MDNLIYNSIPRTKEAAMEKFILLKKEYRISKEYRHGRLADQRSLLDAEVNDALKALAVIVITAISLVSLAFIAYG